MELFLAYHSLNFRSGRPGRDRQSGEGPVLKANLVTDSRTESEIREIEDFWGNQAPTYPGWEWVRVPEEVRERVDSYHRVARLQLEAPRMDWDSPLARLGVKDAIDGHSHLAGFPSRPDLMDKLEKVLDRAGIKYIVNLALETYWDDYIREMEEGWLPSRLAGRVLMFPTFDWKIDEPRWVERACAFLDRARKLGARGVKVHKDLGVAVTTHGKIARLNDSRLKELFGHAGDLGLPVWIHYGDPWMFLKPLEGNERLREITCFPDWHLYKKNFGEKDAWQLHQDFFDLVESTPQTNFTAVHFANYPWERMDEFIRLLEHYPNLYTDTSGRMAESGRGKTLEGRDYRAEFTSRMIARCQDKVIFGTDMLPTDKLYQTWSLFLRSDLKDLDYTFASFYPGQGDWLVDGLRLEQGVLNKMCRDTAAKLIGL
jgi:uncharacterized protein